MTAADFSALQNNVTDYLSTLIVPKLTDALQDASLDPEQREALGEIAGWDNQMTATSTGATIWWTFWNNYLTYVFRPWWDAGKIPVLQEQHWSGYQRRAPGGVRRTAAGEPR